MFNLANQFREFHFIQGKLAQDRLHVYMIAPPGYTKSMLLQRFVQGPNSVLGCTGSLGEIYHGNQVGSVKCGWEGSTTEAGFIGSYKAAQGGGHEQVLGAAHEHKYGVMGIDEFSALSNMMKMEHSMNLDNAMLLALDSGWCIKRLAAGKIEYLTQLTLMTGCFVPETPVVIKRNELINVIPICDTLVGDKIWDNSEWVKVEHVIPQQFNGNIKYIGSRTSVFASTPQHMIFDEQGNERSVKDINVDDYLQVSHPKLERSVDSEVGTAFVQGFYCAEGWRHQDWKGKPGRSFHLTNTKIEHIEKVMCYYGEEKFCDIHWYDGTKCYDVAIKSVYAEDFLCCHSSSNVKIVPVSILNGSKKVQNAFVRGFLLGDGNNFWRKGSFEQATKRGALTTGIRLMLPYWKKCGSIPSISINKYGTRSICTEMRPVYYTKKPYNQVVKTLNRPYNGTVYDLKTASRRYSVGIGNLTTVHNSQPGRFNLTSGLGRRLFFLYFIPTAEEMDLIKRYMRKGRNKRPNYSRLKDISNDIKKIQEDLMNIKKVTVNNSFYKLMDNLRVPHMEEILYERMAIGHQLAYYNGTDAILDVDMCGTLEEDIIRAVDWRTEIKKGAETSQVFQVCKELNNHCISEVKERLTNFGVEYQKSQILIEQLVRQGRIITPTVKAKGAGKAAQIVIVKY